MKQKEYILIRILCGVIIGIFSGLIICLYRFLMNMCDSFLNKSVFPALHSGNISLFFAWGAALLLLSQVVFLMIRREPDALGGGIPHAIKEAEGTSDSKWWSVILAKLISAPLCILAGFSLGKTGPAVELGSMSGKGIHRLLSRIFSKKEQLISDQEFCSAGAGAGLSALFSAPTSGIMFVIEKFPQISNISSLTFCSSSLTAFWVSDSVFGTSPIVAATIPYHFPIYYPALAFLGILLGITGTFYARSLGTITRILSKYNKCYHGLLWSILFLLAGVIGYFFPVITGGGSNMLAVLMQPSTACTGLLLLLLGKYLFSMISSGSGLPGGTVFPLLTVGACLGQLYGICVMQLFPDTGFVSIHFLLAGMAGFFASVVEAPFTAAFLLCELSCDYHSLLPLCVVCLCSHLTSKRIKKR